MNANELADIQAFKTEELTIWERNTTATMLRHQADRIRNLEKSLGFKNSGYETINLTPQLELTDEEIDAVGDKVSNLIDTYAGRREFARAILRKAQEK